MLALDIQRNGRVLSMELPAPIEVLAGELRAIGIYEPLDKIPQSEFTLRHTSGFGKHFMKLIQPEDTLHRIASCCNAPGSLADMPMIQLSELIMADRFRDLDHMADYLQYGPDALYGLMRMEYNGRDIVLPAPLRVLQDRFGFDRPMGETRLAEAELSPVSEMGRQLIVAFQPYSDTVATANMACSMAQHVPDITAAPAQIVEGARKIQAPMPTETMCFICPLKVSVEEEDNPYLVEGDPDLLVYHEDEIRDALKDELPAGENMADYLDGVLKQKIASMEWDVTRVKGALYGSISCELRAPLSTDEQAGLIDWITGQNSDGLCEGFEQHPVDTDDGELYVHFWHSGDDYFVMPAEEFFQQLHEQTMPGPAAPENQITFYCPLAVSCFDDDEEDLVDIPNKYLIWHEDEVRAALRAEIREGENMAQYLDPALQDKVASAEWDIAVIDGTAYGIITCELTEPLDVDEQAELAGWISGQNSDGLGEGWEQRPVKTSDGELYVHLWEYSDDYFVLPEDEFRAQVLEQGLNRQGFGAMGGMS